MDEPDNDPVQPGTAPAPNQGAGRFGGEEGQVLLSADPQSWDRLRRLLRTVSRPPGIIIVAIVLAITALVLLAG